MSKLNVIPSNEDMEAAKRKAEEEKYHREKIDVAKEIYENTKNSNEVNQNYASAVEAMMKRTQEQLNLKNNTGVVVEDNLSEVKKVNKVVDTTINQNKVENKNYNTIKTNMTTKNKPENYGELPSNLNSQIIELSQPDFNSAFDVIPLPSQGKVYRNRKPNIKVSYMTTADENILTSPNLLQSGEFLKILINRKILDTELRYEDLLIGDRNAIMIWLRATSYGEMYPVTLLDELDDPFDTEVNLNDLKIKKLEVDPDDEGLFTFTLPISKSVIKFKLLTCGDVDVIEQIIAKEKEDNVAVNNTNTYTLEKMIVEIDGDRDRNLISNLSKSMRIGDSKALLKYISTIEPGIDLNISVPTPRGGSIDTFLPLNIKFFWPDARI
jgi:hypothetical protein